MRHHNKQLMVYFEFLNDSRIIYLSLKISEKLHWQYVYKKLERERERERLIAFIFIIAIQYARTLKNNIYYSKKRGPPTFSHLDTNLVIGHALVHSVDKTHVLVVTVDFIWLLFLNILSFNFAATPWKSLRS